MKPDGIGKTVKRPLSKDDKAAENDTNKKRQEGFTYTGEHKDGKFNGFGKMTEEGGKSVLIGEFKDGRLDGQGYFEVFGSYSYSGQFHNSLFHGHGKWKSAAYTYEGEYVNGMINGHGKMERSTGMTYIGDFVKG